MFSNRIFFNHTDPRFTCIGWNRMDYSFEAAIECTIAKRMTDEEDVFKIHYCWDQSDTDYLNRDDEYDLVIAYPRNVRNFHDSGNLKDRGYVEDEDLEKFYKKNYKIKVIIYKNTSLKRTIIIPFKKDLISYHVLTTGIPKYFPWYFDDAPLTNEELVFIMAFAGDDISVIERYINEYAAEKQVDVLELIGQNMKRAKIDNAKHEIKCIEEELDNYNNRIVTLMERRREWHERLAGIYANEEADAGKAFKDYILANKNIKLKEVNNSTCRFEIDSILTNYDLDYAEVLYKDIENGVGRYGNVFSQVRINDTNDWKRFFKATFIDKRFKVKMRASYSIDVVNFGFHAERMFTIPNDRVPNPHIEDFRCLGDYYGLMNDAMQRGDVPGMLMVAQVSAASVNLMEYPSARNFFNYISSMREQKIITDNNGNDYTVMEVIEMIKMEEGIEGQNFVENAEVQEWTV